MNESQTQRLAIAQLQDQLAKMSAQVAARGRITVSQFSEGLSVLLQAAEAGDQGAQSDLKMLRELLAAVAASDAEPVAAKPQARLWRPN